MQAIKFTYVDILKSKFIVVFFIILGVVGFYMMKGNGPLNGVYYMSFAGVIGGIQPFIQEQTAEVGFINMLPGTRKSRVLGRYLYGLILQIIAIVINGLNLTIYSALYGELPDFILEGILISFGISIFFCSIQYLLFFGLGKIKSQQMASIIMMLPGFIMFFGIGYIGEFILNNNSFNPLWIVENGMKISAATIVAGLVFWVLGIVLSHKITEKKDYA